MVQLVQWPSAMAESITESGFITMSLKLPNEKLYFSLLCVLVWSPDNANGVSGGLLRDT